MPNFRRIHQFTTFVDEYNTKDNDEDEATLNNLVDPNYGDIKAIKKDNALRKFAEKTKYSNVEVANIYKSAEKLGYLQQRDSSNSTHIQGVGIIVPEEGKEFIYRSERLKLMTGKWHAIIAYYAPWYLVLSIIAIIISIISVIISLIKT